MQHIFVDFEMHPIYRKHSKERRICRDEIIEFGAVMLDDHLREISSFKAHVKPEYMERMTAKISNLTGISAADLAIAKKFSEVLESFVSWCASEGDDYRIFAWSDNDLVQVKAEMKLKQIEMTDEIKDMFDKWEDFQKEYCEILSLDRAINLEKALNTAGIAFDGRMHDALWDSRNTAQLYKETRDREAFLKAHEQMQSMIHDESEGVTNWCLGDIFDFTALNIA